MKYLLDVNVLLAVIWGNHPQHARALAWIEEKQVLVCPLSQLGFLRISTNKKALNYPMDKSRQLLEKFKESNQAEWIPDNLDALLTNPKKSEEVTDLYLAELAAKHGARLATFDQGIVHESVVCI